MVQEVDRTHGVKYLALKNALHVRDGVKAND
jgi:hypothetical protein